MLFFSIGFCLFNIVYNLFIHYIGIVRFTCYWGQALLYQSSLNLPKHMFNGFHDYIFASVLKLEPVDVVTKPATQFKKGIWTLTTELEAIKSLEAANIFSFEVFTLMCIMFNICVCVDVFLVFKNPFYPSYKRMKVYIISSTVIVCLIYPF